MSGDLLRLLVEAGEGLDVLLAAAVLTETYKSMTPDAQRAISAYLRSNRRGLLGVKLALRWLERDISSSEAEPDPDR